MILFVSDMHFGRGTPVEERASETALVDCLRAYEATVEQLFLVGDVFDEFIEYRTLIPKGFVRFQGLLAAWADQGVPITYLVGNHDPWHRDYFERELGIRMIYDYLLEDVGGQQVYLTHGDGLASTNRLYRQLKPWLRHPIPVWLYRSLLPADTGLRFARWFNRRFGNLEVDPVTIEGLRVHARRLLVETNADLIVMGHSHYPEIQTWPEGRYLNTGSWHDNRTFAALDADGLHLLRWNGAVPVAVDHETYA